MSNKDLSILDAKCLWLGDTAQRHASAIVH